MDKTIYDTMEKTMVLHRELWNFDLRRKEKNMVDFQKLRNFDL